MKLLFLHGSPAVGKLTIAREVLRLVPGRLFDNHASIDFAKTLFAFGAPGFWDLVLDARVAGLKAAAAQDLPLVVMTYCYVSPKDLPEFESFEKAVLDRGGELLPVFLHCARDVAMSRIDAPDRKARDKMDKREALAKYLDENEFRPVPRAGVLAVDTGIRSARDSAKMIAQHMAAARHSA